MNVPFSLSLFLHFCIFALFCFALELFVQIKSYLETVIWMLGGYLGEFLDFPFLW